ncbi:hypothetical protein [Stagnimonas aquatica]|uniref:hypothetical protein n=1 Tax=Stagnimonas aquatica TaxID=2689987 RepID=UPI0011CE0D24|nr:hypothetical protein [Stagnimonas aquatica]
MRFIFSAVAAAILFTAPAYACSPEGAYGFAFGSKPARLGEKLYGNDASVWYVGEAPEPDARFDRYEIRLDADKRQIFEIVAVKITYGLPADGKAYSPAEVQEGKSLSRKFAMEYIATLPEAVKTTLVDKYGTGSWDGSAAEGYHIGIGATTPYKVTVSCLDNKREWAVARKVMPGLFGK